MKESRLLSGFLFIDTDNLQHMGMVVASVR